MKLHFKAGYKYITSRDFLHITSVVGFEAKNDFIALGSGGDIYIKKCYAFDGASGPTIDTANTMRGALVHDALYQLMREKLLPITCREAADRTLYNTIREDKMCYIRAQAWLKSVRLFAAGAAKPSGGNPEKVAP